MSLGSWEDLIGAVVEGRYRLRTLIDSGRDQAEYIADPVAAPTNGGVTITLIAAEPHEFDGVLAHMKAASRLQHPNLLRILSFGHCEAGGRELLYLASVKAERTLAQSLSSGPLEDGAAQRLILNIADALAYLHQQGLIYCGLQPETTVWMGARWKLADYGRMCHSGALPDGAARSRYAPPEAAGLTASPSWDAWMLGAMLRDVLGVSSAGELLRPRFRNLVAACTSLDPAARPAAQEIAHMVTTREPVAEVPDAQPLVSAAIPRSAAGVSWKLLRRMALVAAAGLAVALPLLLWKKAPARSGNPASVVSRAADTGSAPPLTGPAHARQAAVPKPLPSRTAPQPEAHAKTQGRTGLADYTSTSMNGHQTASGERFDSSALTAAAPYPLGTLLRVTNLQNSRSVVVRVNDRGSFRHGRVVHLTPRAAHDLGMTAKGSARVRVEVVD